MGQREPKRLSNYLRGCGCAKKLATTARRGASATTYLRRILERNLPLREAHTDGLHLARIFARFGKERHSSRNEDTRQRAGRSERHHHRGQALVAGRHSDNPFARRQRTHQSPEHDSGIIAVGQRIQHPVRPLSAAVARIGACACVWDAVLIAEFAGGLGYQESYLPMARVEAKRNRRSVLRAHSAMSAEDQKLRVKQARRFPTHSDRKSTRLNSSH